jgi:hypothetical protein
LKIFPRKKTQKKYDTSISPYSNCPNICSLDAFMARRSGGSGSSAPVLWPAEKAIEERVQFARARMGDYEVIDFVVMLMGYAVSGEQSIKAFYERLLPFASPFMALFGRANLPHRETLSRSP